MAERQRKLSGRKEQKESQARGSREAVKGRQLMVVGPKITFLTRETSEVEKKCWSNERGECYLCCTSHSNNNVHLTKVVDFPHGLKN